MSTEATEKLKSLRCTCSYSCSFTDLIGDTQNLETGSSIINGTCYWLYTYMCTCTSVRVLQTLLLTYDTPRYKLRPDHTHQTQHNLLSATEKYKRTNVRTWHSWSTITHGHGNAVVHAYVHIRYDIILTRNGKMKICYWICRVLIQAHKLSYTVYNGMLRTQSKIL